MTDLDFDRPGKDRIAQPFDFSKAEQAGRDAVDEFHAELEASADPELGQYDEGEIAADLLRTLQPGHVPWSESAAGNRVHAMLGCPNDDNSRAEFYRAYDRGAAARIREICGE